MKKKSDPIFIAASVIEGQPVEVWGRPRGTAGGDFETCPTADCRKPSRITIDLDREHVYGVLKNLYHEVFECSLMLHQCRYVKSNADAADSGAYYFWLTHEAMGEVTAQVAWFLHKTQRAVETAWRKHRP